MAGITMKTCITRALRRAVRCASTNASPRLATANRTSVSDPGLHSSDHVGMFYSITEDLKEALFSNGGLPRPFMENTKTFGETSIMIRTPALDVINLMKSADYTRPVIRYVLYGKPGCGKSLSLAHIINYCFVNGFLILHVPWVWNWMKSNRCEVVTSKTRQNSFDLPIVGSLWLKQFAHQNAALLENPNLIKLTKDYVWNQREMTPSGSPLIDLIKHGINRVKYSCDVIDAILNEVKAAASNKQVRALIAIDGFNGFFAPTSQLRAEDRSRVVPAKVSLAQSFMDAVTSNWTNGAVVLTLDQISGPFNHWKSSYPLSLIGRKGFEMLDPFIGVQVNEFSENELHSMLDYYEDRRWLSSPACNVSRRELAFLSNSNPYVLMQMCSGL